MQNKAHMLHILDLQRFIYIYIKLPPQQNGISGVAPIVHRHHGAFAITVTVAVEEGLVTHVQAVKDQLDDLTLLHLDGPATGEVLWERSREVGTADAPRLVSDEAVPTLCRDITITVIILCTIYYIFIPA